MKKKKIAVITAAVLIGGMFFNFGSIGISASDTDEKNMTAAVLLKDYSEKETVKSFINNEGGEVLDEIDSLGEIKVKCSEETAAKIKENEDVEYISSISKVKMKDVEADYWHDSNNGYWQDNSSQNGYWQSYWQSSNNSNWGENTVEAGKNDKPAYVLDDKQWDIKRITNDGASFSLEAGNHDVVVGIIDSGVDTDHPDLKDNLLGGENCVPENYLGDSSETGAKDDIEDRYGHGTGVAGEIAANGTMKGVAPEIGYKCYRVFDRYGDTDFFLCADAITKAVDDGVKVLNLSLGSFYLDGSYTYTDRKTHKVTEYESNKDEYQVIKRAVDYAARHNVVVVAASGNEGVDCSKPEILADYFNMNNEGYRYKGNMYNIPGTLDGVIAVGAVDKKDKFATYSNYGEGFLDISAPVGNYIESCWTTSMGGGYNNRVGTSFAAPKVSAAAALLLCKDKTMNAEDVEKQLCDSCDKAADEYSVSHCGAGIVNVYKALSK